MLSIFVVGQVRKNVGDVRLVVGQVRNKVGQIRFAEASMPGATDNFVVGDVRKDLSVFVVGQVRRTATKMKGYISL